MINPFIGVCWSWYTYVGGFYTELGGTLRLHCNILRTPQDNKNFEVDDDDDKLMKFIWRYKAVIA